MPVVIVTGSGGLVGSEAVKFYCEQGYDVVGIDNNMRKDFFGDDACTLWNSDSLKRYENYEHHSVDIRDYDNICRIFNRYKPEDIKLIIHAAAQPSHDWAASNAIMDFSINANGTLVLLEQYRKYCPEAVFIYTSTNKVYGDMDGPRLREEETRYELGWASDWYGSEGVNETMPVDQTKHSLFGVSKLSADLMVQEYGKYFGLKTVCFRCGCITGPTHSGTKLHGFLSYLMKCCITGNKYYIYGYKGKQVRDNIHSYDLINAFDHFFRQPSSGRVYNMGGGRYNSISVLEAIEKCERISRKKLNHEYINEPRIGDHKWWISDITKFWRVYPAWDYKYTIDDMLEEIYNKQSTL